MQIKKVVSAAVFAAVMAVPLAMVAQTQDDHDVAKAQVEHKDKHHHNKAKLVGGGAAGGAAVGAMAGGPVGAVVGAGIGAVSGVVGNKIRKHHSIKKQEKENAGVPQ
ncbi:hypothetical protein [Terriglobus sp.]|uniref:hypothetical protein n=1 Tax=Terriglobus sp. TaxID=1889013 RepID=UPI003AFFB954